MVSKLTVNLGTAAFLLLAFSQPAHAYLARPDPGTGSIVLQAMLGGAAGVIIAGKLYWSKFKAQFVNCMH